MDAVYASVFVNYNQYRDDLTIGEMGDILVVCTDRDEAVMDPYIQWKREKGFVVSKEVVAAGTNVVSIVQNAYNANNNILYVQLVGDWADIKCNTLNGGTSPMDPQVGCVAGNDEVPDIAVGRFSAENPTHVTTQVNKVIEYEKLPEMGGAWYKTATGIASDEGPGDDQEFDFEHQDVIYYDKLSAFTYDNFNTIYDPGAAPSDVTNAVNAGTGVINYTGHGDVTIWGTSYFSNSHVAALSNGNKLPFIISVACLNGSYNLGTSFSEAWQRHTAGGSVMFLGASISQPWNPPMRGQDYMADLLTGGYDYAAHAGQNGISTTEGRTTVGSIVMNSLVLMTTEAGNPEDWETAKTWNIFGDPSMQVRTDTPAELSLSNNIVMVGVPFSTMITTNGTPVEGAMVTISKDGSYFTAITDASGMVSITHTLDEGEGLLVVTAFNTETIYDNIFVISPNGPYVIYSGHTIEDAGGNNNGLLDYGEQVLISVSLTNVGTVEATDVSAHLSTDDSYISIIDGVDNVGNIAPGDTITYSGIFEVLAHADIPDLHDVLFTIEAIGDDTWSSSFSEKGHAPVLVYDGYEISDPAGNGNGKLDPDETADVTIMLTNEGSADAYNVEGLLSTESEFVTIGEPGMVYGPLAAGETASQTWSLTADAATPAGHNAIFAMDISADLGVSGLGEFYILVGQIPVLVIDLDGNENSSAVMMACFDNLSVNAERVESWPDDMNMYASIFVCLGVYPDNYVLNQSEGQELANFLGIGGRLYMEGGDTWFYDPATPVHSMFSIQGVEDGGSDLNTIVGQSGTFTEGLQYAYDGDNNWIDRISPIGDAVTIFKNLSPSYGTAVAYDEGNYRTIGSSFEFGGLEDGDATTDYLMHKYLEFFDIGSVFVGLPQEAEGFANEVHVYPNPAESMVNIMIETAQDTPVSIEVLSVNGQVMHVFSDNRLTAGINTLSWDASAMPGGVYFLRILSSSDVITRKLVIRN